MRKRLISVLRKKATRYGRGQAYVDDVLNHARFIEGGHYWISDDDYKALREKWAERDSIKSEQRNRHYKRSESLPRVRWRAGHYPLAPEPVGDDLHDVIEEEYGANAHEDCGCPELQRKMNRGGLRWTYKHYDEIVQHLAGNADKVGGKWKIVMKVPGAKQALGPIGARRLLDRAIARAEQRAASRGKVIRNG